MTEREKDQVKAMYIHYGYMCFVDTTRKATQRAHIIGNTKPNRNKYGNHIIDNPLNWLPAADLDNNKLIDIGKFPIYCERIKNIIDSDLSRQEKRSIIENIVRDNIKRKQNKKIVADLASHIIID